MNNVILARPWQLDAVPLGRDARFFLVQAPGGSGKSLFQCFLGTLELEAWPGQKQLILVPQTHIHRGFYGEDGQVFWRLTPEGEEHRWVVRYNFCGEDRHGRVDRLRQFLLADPVGLGEFPTAVATHQAFVAAWKGLTDRQRVRAVRHLTLRIDEAHHVKGVLLEREEDSEIELSTRLGEACRFALNCGDPTCKLHLTTATFFRGDRAKILSPAVRDLFVSYYLPWDTYWPTLGIDELYLEYLDYTNDPVDQVCAATGAEPDRRHLLILPPLGQKYRDATTLSRFLVRLQRIYPDERVLDLVSPATQEKNKALLQGSPERYHAVLSCRLFNEGTDWVPCDRLHNTDACEKSLTLAVQRFFRPLRKHPAKKCVKVFNYLPQFHAGLGDEEQRRLLSDRSNALLAGVVLDLEIMPVAVPLRSKDGRAPGRVALQELYGQDSFRDILGDLAEGLIGGQGMDALTDAVIDQYGLPAGVDRAALRQSLSRVAERLARPASFTPGGLQVPGVDLAGVRNAFDIVQVKSGLLGRYFGTENIDGEMLDRLIRTVRPPLTLADIHFGILEHYLNVSERLTNQSGFIEELQIEATTLASRLQRMGTTLAREVEAVLGPAKDPLDGLLEKTNELIRLYHERHGVRLSKNYGVIEELGITGMGLQHRLEKLGTTLAKEVDRVLGCEQVEVISLDKIKRVLADHIRAGRPLSKHGGRIEALSGLSAAALDERLKRHHRLTLARLNALVARECGLELKQRHPVTGNFRKKVLALHAKGESSRSIAAALGLTKSTVQAFLTSQKGRQQITRASLPGMRAPRTGHLSPAVAS